MVKTVIFQGKRQENLIVVTYKSHITTINLKDIVKCTDINLFYFLFFTNLKPEKCGVHFAPIPLNKIPWNHLFSEITEVNHVPLYVISF